MKMRPFAIFLASVLLIEGRPKSAIASAETTPGCSRQMWRRRDVNQLSDLDIILAIS